MNPGGGLFYFLLLTVAVTAVVSPFAIWRYGAAVLAGMRVVSGAEVAPGVSTPRRRSEAPPSVASETRSRWERGAQRRAVVAWLAATALAATPLALIHNRVGGLPLTPVHVVLVVAVMTLVAVPPIALSLGWSWREGLWRAALLSLAAAVAVTLLSVVQRVVGGGVPSPDQWLNIVIFYQLAWSVLLLPLPLFLASAAARIRGVVAMTFGGLFVFGIGPYVASTLWVAIGSTRAGTQAMLETPWLGSRHLLFVALALPFGLLMGWRLQALARAYAAKKFSDVQLLARSWWLMFVAMTAIGLLNARPDLWWAALAAVATAALYGPSQRVVFKVLGVARNPPPPVTLLLLRVFGFRSRTERLFDRIGARWRWHGPVTMIAAPDVVSRTIDAVDFLDWLLGRSGSQFVRSADELQTRLAAIDRERDPDGRFRVSEFCCADNTWRATIVALMERADVVLMDLRGITRERKGCEYELQQLARRLPPRRVVLVVDPGGDRAPVEAALGAAAAQVHWCEVQGDRRAANRALFDTLLRASAGA